jgi:tripartite ATP-independent transporter DctM subunit
MFDPTDTLILIGVMLVTVFLGVHIAVALGITAAFGIYLMHGDLGIVRSFVAQTAYEALRDYVFAVIPLFMLMGEFLAKCGAASDLYKLVNRLTRIVPGRLAVATVVSNTLFAFVTGVSIAAAAAFSRIAYPEMVERGYRPRFAVGCIAGSACLGMLIPPSVLLIVWGVLTEQSIGHLFMAGIIPGLLLAGLFIVYILGVALLRPADVGASFDAGPVSRPDADGRPLPILRDRELLRLVWSTTLVLGLVFGVLAGIWFGAFTPTEGAGVGAAAALVLALIKGLRLRGVLDVILSVGRTSAPLLLLLVFAQLYARVLAMTGVTAATQAFFADSGLPPWAIIAMMMLIWLVLGCFIDSISIMLITVPVFMPIAVAIGMDPMTFAILGILTIEAGLLTPPFGMLIFTVKSALPDSGVMLSEMFRGTIPFWIALLLLAVLVAVFPPIATWLPSLIF